MRKLIIALLLAALPVKADLLPALYDTVTGRLSIPTNITGFTFGGILFTNFTGLGLTNVNGTLRVDTNVIGGGSGGGSGTVTSVGGTSTVAGIQFSGPAITASGTLSLTGIVADASIDPAIARVSAVAAGYQPLDPDLTDIAGIAASNGDYRLRPDARRMGQSIYAPFMYRYDIEGRPRGIGSPPGAYSSGPTQGQMMFAE